MQLLLYRLQPAQQLSLSAGGYHKVPHMPLDSCGACQGLEHKKHQVGHHEQAYRGVDPVAQCACAHDSTASSTAGGFFYARNEAPLLSPHDSLGVLSWGPKAGLSNGTDLDKGRRKDDRQWHGESGPAAQPGRVTVGKRWSTVLLACENLLNDKSRCVWCRQIYMNSKIDNHSEYVSTNTSFCCSCGEHQSH